MRNNILLKQMVFLCVQMLELLMSDEKKGPSPSSDASGAMRVVAL